MAADNVGNLYFCPVEHVGQFFLFCAALHVRRFYFILFHSLFPASLTTCFLPWPVFARGNLFRNIFLCKSVPSQSPAQSSQWACAGPGVSALTPSSPLQNLLQTLPVLSRAKSHCRGSCLAPFLSNYPRIPITHSSFGSPLLTLSSDPHYAFFFRIAITHSSFVSPLLILPLDLYY